MPAHRVAKAAAVLIAATATVIPVAETTGSGPASASFVEVLQGPNDLGGAIAFVSDGNNIGCNEE